MEHAKTCQRPISLERRLAATYLVAGLITAGLAGCAAGPDFQRPTAPDVARYTAIPVADRTASAPTQFGETQRLVEGLPIETQWWQSLGSSALDGLINEAFHVSPTLASISANLRQAQELLAAQAGSTPALACITTSIWLAATGAHSKPWLLAPTTVASN